MRFHSRVFNVVFLANMTSLLAFQVFSTLAAEPVLLPLSLGEAQRLAVQQSRQLVAQDALTDAARHMAVAAGQRPDPVLRFGVDNFPLDGADKYSFGREFMTMRRIGISQEFPREEKRKLKAERFEREADRNAAEKMVSLANVQRDTALAWIDRYYTNAMRAVLTEQAQETRLQVEAAESAFRAGRGMQADIFAARAAVVSLADRASQIDRLVSNAATMLARWIGDAAARPLGDKPDWQTLRFDAGHPDAEIQRHPQLESLTQQINIADADVRLAQANKKSDWSVEVTYAQRGSSFSNMLSVGVSIPLQWDRMNRQDRELSSRLAMVEEARARRDDALRNHELELRTLINDWRSGLQRVARLRDELLPLTRQRSEAALSSYRGGKGDLSALLTARRDEIEARLQTLQTEMDTVRVWAQLNYLLPEDAPRAALANKEAP